MSKDQNEHACQCGKAHDDELTDQEAEEVAGGGVPAIPIAPINTAGTKGVGGRGLGSNLGAQDLGGRRDGHGIVITSPPE